MRAAPKGGGVFLLKIVNQDLNDGAFLALIFFHPVFFGELTDHSARIARGETVWRNVPGHHTACPDNTPFTDGYSSADGDVGGQPAVASNGYRLCVFKKVQAAVLPDADIAFFRKERMHGSGDRDVRSHQHIVTNMYRADVKACKVEVDPAVFSKICITPVVKLNGRLEYREFGGVGKQLFKNVRLPFCIILIRQIILS